VIDQLAAVAAGGSGAEVEVVRVVVVAEEVAHVGGTAVAIRLGQRAAAWNRAREPLEVTYCSRVLKSLAPIGSCDRGNDSERWRLHE